MAFNEEQYLAANPDVARAIASGKYTKSAEHHYNTFGKKKGRKLTATPAQLKRYRAKNSSPVKKPTAVKKPATKKLATKPSSKSTEQKQAIAKITNQIKALQSEDNSDSPLRASQVRRQVAELVNKRDRVTGTTTLTYDPMTSDDSIRTAGMETKTFDVPAAPEGGFVELTGTDGGYTSYDPKTRMYSTFDPEGNLLEERAKRSTGSRFREGARGVGKAALAVTGAEALTGGQTFLTPSGGGIAELGSNAVNEVVEKETGIDPTGINSLSGLGEIAQDTALQQSGVDLNALAEGDYTSAANTAVKHETGVDVNRLADSDMSYLDTKFKDMKLPSFDGGFEMPDVEWNPTKWTAEGLKEDLSSGWDRVREGDYSVNDIIGRGGDQPPQYAHHSGQQPQAGYQPYPNNLYQPQHTGAYPSPNMYYPQRYNPDGLSGSDVLKATAGNIALGTWGAGKMADAMRGAAGTASGRQDPYAGIGQQAVNALMGNVDPVTGVRSSVLGTYGDPSYDWRREESERAINRGMTGSMGGKFRSGNRINAIMERAGDMASQEYGASHGRAMAEAGMGANAATRQGGYDMTAGGAEAGKYQNLINTGQQAVGDVIDFYGKKSIPYSPPQFGSPTMPNMNNLTTPTTNGYQDPARSGRPSTNSNEWGAPTQAPTQPQMQPSPVVGDNDPNYGSPQWQEEQDMYQRSIMGNMNPANSMVTPNSAASDMPWNNMAQFPWEVV